MDNDESHQQNQNLHGFVIITLPPADNPSVGKSITAFTLTDDDLAQSSLAHDQNHHEEGEQGSDQQRSQQHPPIQQDTGSTRSSDGMSWTPRRTMRFLGILIFALALLGAVFRRTSLDFDDDRDDDDEKPSSIYFPLYRKSNSGDPHLGRFLDFQRGHLAASNGLETIKARNFSRLLSAGVAVSSSAVFPARGNVYPDGLYYTYILVGDPPRPYYFDIDTGSDLTWVQCDAPCISCGKGANGLYQPQRGKIVPPKDPLCSEIQNHDSHCWTCQQCDYEIEYADHSSSLGVLAKDKLHLIFPNGSSIEPDVVFGCGYDQQGILLKTLSKTDGILGLSRAKVSLPSQLASQGIINNVVGHCLGSEIEGSGYMFLGDAFVPQHGMAWVPMLKTNSKDFYRTIITGISYGGHPLRIGRENLGAERIVFDSGSSYTYFTKQAYEELVRSLAEVSEFGLTMNTSDTGFPICWQAGYPISSVMEITTYFSPITLQFGSKWWIRPKTFLIPPEGYLITKDKGSVCLGILEGSHVHDGGSIILGDISLRGQLIVYDNVGRKIGWAKSDCIKPKELLSLPDYEA